MQPEVTRKLFAYGLSIVTLGAVVSPMLAARDSFPLSTYPMFAHTRPSVVDIDHLVAIDAQGGRRIVPPSLVARGEVLQAKAMIDGTVQRGRRATALLCREVAARLAQDAAWADMRTLEVRRDSFDVLGYFSGQREPQSSRVHARCRIGARR
jgi:hypothetical protein